MSELKLWNKYSFSGISVLDRGIKDFVNLNPVIIPKSNGRFQKKRFWKSKSNIVERLINKMQCPGHKGKKHFWTSRQCAGKYYTSSIIVEKAFGVIEKKTGRNPLEIFVRAVENSAPKEEVTTIEYGGTKAPKAVDVSPQRRVDLVLRWFIQGTYQEVVNKKKTMYNTLAGMIMQAAEKDPQCYPIKKKNELERQAASSR